MKRALLLIVALLLSSSAAYAQDSTFVSSKKQKRVRLPQIQYHHEFRVGIGYYPNNMSFFGCRGHDFNGDFNSEYGGYWEDANHYYLGDPIVYSAYYGYRIIKGLKVTLTLSYAKYEKRHFGDAGGAPSSEIVGRYREDSYRISPSIQYEWINRGIVTLYTEAGCTFDFTHQKETVRGNVINNEWIMPGTSGWFNIRPTFTLIGITVGKKLFGHAEVFSFGPRGLFNAGIGYRF